MPLPFSQTPVSCSIDDREPAASTTVMLPATANTFVLLYETDTAAAIMSMTTPDKTKRSAPFLQRIQLVAPDGYPVRATGQVDDGAMRNCISKKRWEQYGHCLSPLSPSTIRISVASGQILKPIGRWHGTVRVGHVSASSWFEVFDSGGAFDVILGKPWLEQVDAVHRYRTDTLEITGANGDRDHLSNQTISETDDAIRDVPMSMLDEEQSDRNKETGEREREEAPEEHEEQDQVQLAEQETNGEHVEQERVGPSGPDEARELDESESAERDPDKEQVVTTETPPQEQLDHEWARIHQIRASQTPWKETRWATYLNVEGALDSYERRKTHDWPPPTNGSTAK